MRRLALLLLLLLVSSAVAQEAELAAAVDLPTAAERRKAALTLARKKEISVEVWQLVMKEFLPRGRHTPGLKTVTAPLTVEGKVEQTEITVYVPEGYTPTRPAPLLLVLHGAGGDGRQEPARWRDIADGLKMIVVAPSEAVEDGGYNFTRRERTSALAVLRWARREFNVDENRIHLTGISRGGHMTWDLGLRHPDRWATLSPMIGGPRLEIRGGQNNLRFTENAVRTPIRDLQGAEDHKAMLFNLRLAFAKLKKYGATDAELKIFEGMGHAFRMEAVDWKEFFSVRARDPSPPKVVRCCVDRREGRAFWVEITALDRSVKETFTVKTRPDVWNALDDTGKRLYLVNAAEERTARLEVTREKPGVFKAAGRGVRRFRLLLDGGAYDPEKPVTVQWKEKTRSKTVRPSKKTLLLDFVERFDRTYLPVVSVTIP